jgi:hypothetical protein
MFRQQGLQHGPCPHLIALRLAYAAQEKDRQSGGAARAKIVTETRSYSRRDAGGEDVYQITLDRERLRLRWGRAGENLRLQQLRFNTLDEARAEYLTRLDDLTAKGFLDATAG